MLSEITNDITAKPLTELNTDEVQDLNNFLGDRQKISELESEVKEYACFSLQKLISDVFRSIPSMMWCIFVRSNLVEAQKTTKVDADYFYAIIDFGKFLEIN